MKILYTNRSPIPLEEGGSWPEEELLGLAEADPITVVIPSWPNQELEDMVEEPRDRWPLEEDLVAILAEGTLACSRSLRRIDLCCTTRNRHSPTRDSVCTASSPQLSVPPTIQSATALGTPLISGTCLAAFSMASE